VGSNIMSTNDNFTQMSANADDIVSRLWQYTPEAQNSPMQTRILLNDAATEIERLRYQMERLSVTLDDISHLTTDRQVQHRIKEARRG